MTNKKNIFIKILLKIKDTFQNHPLNIAVFLGIVNGLMQLALSNSHINSIVKVNILDNDTSKLTYTTGIPTTGIGLFFFFFILFNLINCFNLLRAKTLKRKIITILFMILTMVATIIYFLKLTNPDAYKNFYDIYNSYILVIVSLIFNVTTITFIIIDLVKEIKNGKQEEIK